MVALDSLLMQWSQSLTFEDMLPKTVSSSPMGLSRGRPSYTFKNFKSVYDASTGRTHDAKFGELLIKFDKRLVSYRSHLTLLGRNRVHETVLHGYVGQC